MYFGAFCATHSLSRAVLFTCTPERNHTVIASRSEGHLDPLLLQLLQKNESFIKNSVSKQIPILRLAKQLQPLHVSQYSVISMKNSISINLWRQLLERLNTVDLTQKRIAQIWFGDHIRAPSWLFCFNYPPNQRGDRLIHCRDIDNFYINFFPPMIEE